MKKSEENAFYQLNETATEIAQLHFENKTAFWINKTVESFSKYELGDECALKELYKIAHFEWQEYQGYIAGIAAQSDESGENTIKTFTVFSRHNTGNLEDDDPLFLQIARVSDKSKDYVKKAIGNYFKTNFISYLKENYRELYEKCEIEEAAKNLIGFSSNLHSEASSSAQALSLTVMQDLVPSSSMVASSYSSLRGLGGQENEGSGL